MLKVHNDIINVLYIQVCTFKLQVHCTSYHPPQVISNSGISAHSQTKILHSFTKTQHFAFIVNWFHYPKFMRQEVCSQKDESVEWVLKLFKLIKIHRGKLQMGLMNAKHILFLSVKKSNFMTFQFLMKSCSSNLIVYNYFS